MMMRSALRVTSPSLPNADEALLDRPKAAIAASCHRLDQIEGVDLDVVRH